MAKLLKIFGETLTLKASILKDNSIQQGGTKQKEVFTALEESGFYAEYNPCPYKSAMYYLDLDSRYIYGNAVKSCTERETNAFFDQLLKTKRHLAEENDAFYKHYFEKTDLIYMDFSNTERAKSTLDQKKKDIEQDAFAKALFDQGLLLKLDSKVRYLVPFDKSASMSRKSVITFIEYSLKEEMDQRLTLGIFQADKTYPLSKVYAYRGLYLSSGLRVEESEFAGMKDERFRLREDTVIVIPDSCHSSRKKEVTVYTEIKRNDGVPEYGTKTYQKKGKETFDVNCFDGEGLISPSYSEALGKYLEEHGMDGSEHATSFQIRLPFGKGMLHTVDFKKFCIEEFHMDPETVMILDAFGIPRKLKDIEIILTESMFKAHKWVKSSFGEWDEDGSLIQDPMKEYFDRFEEYEHALYILRTDKSLFNEGYVSLNYQFLNTGILTGEQFEGIVNDSLNQYVAKLEDDDDEKRRFIGSHRVARIKDNDGLSEEKKKEEESQRIMAKYALMIQNHPEFIRDTKIKGMISSAAKSRYTDTMRGNVLVRGENRFLSGDLLCLLRDFAHLCITDEKDQNVKDFYTRFDSQRLRGDYFLAPLNVKTGIKWEKGKEYAVLRNPHLSRNEQCALKPYILWSEKDCPDEKKNLYQKYLRKLSGVLMLPYGSPVAERLGGADFDGDMVKIYVEETFNQSAAESYKNNHLVQIPHGSEVPKMIPQTVKYEDIKDGFDSKVGQISNLAIKFGEVEYNENLKNETKDNAALIQLKKELKTGDKDYAAISCILVGQEIDKAKTGEPPYLEEVNEKSKSMNKAQLDFLALKDKLAFTKFKSPKKETVTVKNEDGTVEEKLTKYYYGSPNSNKKLLEANVPSEETPNLERLIFRVIDFGENRKDNKPNKEKSQRKERPVFKSVSEKDIDRTVLEQMGAIMLAYAQTQKKASLDYQRKQRYLNTQYYSYVRHILNVQYEGTIDGRLPLDQAASQVYSLVERLGQDDPGAINKLLEQIVNDKWQYTLPEKRHDKLREYFAKEKYQSEEGESYDEYEEDFAVADKLFSNFNGKGYFLLYYVVKDVLRTRSLSDDSLMNDGTTDKTHKKISDLLTLFVDRSCKEWDKKRKKDAYTYLVSLMVRIYHTSEKLKNWQQDMLKQEEKELSPEMLKGLFQMKSDLKEYPEDLTWEKLISLSQTYLPLLESYEKYKNKYYKIYKTMHSQKRDLDEEGNEDPKKLKTELAENCLEDVKELFAQNRMDLNDAVKYWGALHQLDENHSFLWEVFPVEYIDMNVSTKQETIAVC